MLDFLLVLCSHRGVMPETIGCIERMKRSNLLFYTAVYAGDALLSRNRSIACSHFVENDWSPYMIFLDDDIVFENRHLEQIHKDMVDGYDIVGGCYAVRDGSQLASYGWDGLLDGKVKEVEYLATGFMGITRKALIQIRDKLQLPLLNPNDWAKCYPFFECGRKTDRKGDPIYISEDWDFCEKARQAGIKTYLDTSVQLGHLGTKKYTVDDVVKTQSAKGESQVLLEQDKLLDLLAEFLNEPKSTVVQHMGENPSAKVGELFKQSGLSITDFYRKGNNWLLYDLIAFNLTDKYKDYKLPIMDGMDFKKVLDFGCGVGAASFYISQKAEVYGYDVCQKMIDFCNFRKEKLGVGNVQFSTELPEDMSDFDCILAIDVFEHIPDLKGILIELGKRVKPGTKLCHIDSFKCDIPVHIDHSEHIDEWLEEAGFIKFDTFRAIKK